MTELLGAKVFWMSHLRPSHGVALLLIVASGSAAQPQAPEWRLSTAPLLTLEDNGTPATEFHRLDFKGTPRRVSLPLASVALSPRLNTAAKEPELQAVRQHGSGEFTNFKYRAENLPPRLPYYAGMIAGANGGLWVQEYSSESSAGARYLVLDAQGRPVGRVVTPPGFRATQAGRDFVVGITRDTDGVEGVRVLRLERR